MNFFEAINGRKNFFPEAKVKNWMYQVILAVDHMHSKGVFHRDIKPENILLKDDVAKLADFGSVRGIGTPHPFTEYISTRWYRAPECMLTNGYYNQEIDIWGIGCVFFEMLTLVPLFPGEESDNKLNEIKQITKVFQNMGPPPISLIERWRKSGVLASVNLNFDFSLPRKSLAPKLKHVSRECVEFIEACLIYDPEARITAAQAKNHPYFRDLRDGEARRYRQISNIRTRERERESSYEG